MSGGSPKKIKIIQDGPYVVTGNVPLEEKIIRENGYGVRFAQGRTYPPTESYALCRCGHSRTMPFCDGHHKDTDFDGSETASRQPFLDQAVIFEGPNLIMADQENLCAFARFCHEKHGDAWELLELEDEKYLDELLKTISECPAGRLVALDKRTGKPMEPFLEQSIVIMQDPSMSCSGPIWVRGGIPIESADGTVYEIRNRVTLCRCGRSDNKPFCDATHVSIGFLDKED